MCYTFNVDEINKSAYNLQKLAAIHTANLGPIALHLKAIFG